MVSTIKSTHRTESIVKVADAVWVAAALLHKEHPQRDDFALKEIVDRVEREKNLGAHKRTTVYAHVTQHCVANASPSTGQYRILVETVSGRRRLFRPGDPCDRRREGKKSIPEPSGLPKAYRPLLDWYHSKFVGRAQTLEERIKNDPILALRGLGKEVWTGVDPDEYVRQLREGWE